MSPVNAHRRSRLRFGLVVGSLLVVAALAAWKLQAWRDREEEARLRERHTLTGTVERHPDFRSTVLGTTRRVWVYLSPQYATEPERRFPVLYLQDGQNVFDGATAFRREGVDLRHVEADGAVHDEVAWAKRLPAVLEFLFPPGA